MFVIIDTYFNLLTCQGPRCRYYPKPSKRVIIVHPDNIKNRKEFGARHGFKVCTGPRYLRGYIGDDNYKSNRLREFTLMWENIGIISKPAGKYPQDSYSAVVRAIQSDWILLQHVT